ncbi:MAG: hypothetical protein JST64_01855 [Actinobacteria bacterium]|nr:hypothetical protein [Actinomycetota bacterium]
MPGDDGNPTDTDDAIELEELRVENERLRSALASASASDVTTATPSGPRHRGRWFASWVLIVVGSLLVPVSVMSVWLDRTITDTDRYVETVAPLIRDPDIQQAVEARLQQALYERVDVEAEVRQLLPDRAALLAGPITAGVKNLVSTLVHRVVTSPRVAQLWDDANRAAQKQVVAALTASNGRKGVVTVDLTDTLKQVVARLDSAGVPFFSSITVPEVKLDLYQSDKVAQVQQAFNLFDKLASVLPWLTLLVLGAGVLVAPDHRKGLVRAASGWVVASLALLVMVAIGRVVYLGALPTGASLPANKVFFNTITRFLRGGGRTVLVVGLVILVAALLTGPSRPAMRFRASLGRLFGTAGSGVDQMGLDLGPFGAWVGRNLVALRVCVAVLALIVFLTLDQPSAGAVLWIALVALVVLAVVEVVGRAGQARAALPTAEAVPSGGVDAPAAADSTTTNAAAPTSEPLT